MLNLVREGEEDYIEAIRYRRRLKIFENFLFSEIYSGRFRRFNATTKFNKFSKNVFKHFATS